MQKKNYVRKFSEEGVVGLPSTTTLAIMVTGFDNRHVKELPRGVAHVRYWPCEQISPHRVWAAAQRIQHSAYISS